MNNENFPRQLSKVKVMGNSNLNSIGLNALSICCFETRKIRRSLDRYNMLFAKCTLNCKCDTTELEQKLVIEKIQAEICYLCTKL